MNESGAVWSSLLGRLDLNALPLYSKVATAAASLVLLVIIAALILITVKRWWPYLWREWFTSLDHKRIGIMYVALSLIMLMRGIIEAVMMRTQQALAVNSASGTSLNRGSAPRTALVRGTQ
ncbi:hypothetical protein BWR59_14025 [Pseudomonas sp. Bc-h]|jgi:cytochrome o ubiquinol oxidase subunit 1|uniref:hypothetical protein n=1 Tax=Pseudomonas sp. Bc-h TaxID=1943632 RepID=UPI0009D9342D|nr:hypothetical protein [Pseudomonas sp. Bc-h]OQR31650.1 hypothetical protein BWR59_14025 [Pseudomonas sp. Bc-h]